MPDQSNPYMVGDPSSGGPSYSRPLLNWQGMANGIGNTWSQRPQQASTSAPGQPAQASSIWQQMAGGGPSGQAAGPMNIRPPMQGGQAPMGWGQRLQQWLQPQQRPGMASPGGPGGQFGGPQPMVPTDQRAPTGLY